MTTPARQEEADRAEQIYHYALVALGAKTVEEALLLWQEVPPTRTADVATRWLDSAIDLIMLNRSIALDLALAYFRLVRALRTGSTIADPRRPEPGTVSIAVLREQFMALVEEANPPDAAEPAEDAAGDAGSGEAEQDSIPDPAPSEEPPALDPDDEDDEVLVEEIDELEALIEQQEQEAEDEMDLLLASLYQAMQNDLVKMDDSPDPAVEIDAARNKRLLKAGAGAAAIMERIMLNAARGLPYALGSVDAKILGWIRFSRTGTPCGWCAMLLSRGFMKKPDGSTVPALYRTRASAGSGANSAGEDTADADKYHNNCKCVAVPVFDLAQLDSPLFDVNRLYATQWPKVTKGLGGNAAMSAWRSFIRRENSTTVAVQEAAA